MKVRVVSTKYVLATGVVIGFENISVSVQEGAGVDVVLYVAVLNGRLGRDVTVWFVTAGRSATGEPYQLFAVSHAYLTPMFRFSSI